MDRIIVGTMTWGIWGRNFSTAEIAQLIEDCIEIGLTCFDHADIYGGYTTEQAFGKGFVASNIPREQVTHISKCGIQYPSEARPLAVKYYDYSKKHIIASVENSLKNLQTDYLDVLLLHRPSPLMDVNEIAAAFETLSKEGKVKSFGASNFSPSQLQLLQKEVSLHWNQIECSLLQSSSMFDGTLDYHQTHAVGTMAWSPLGSFFKEENSTGKRVKELLSSLVQKYTLTEDQLLLAWLLQHPARIHPVVGTTRIDRLKAAKETSNVKLDIQDWFLLLEAQKGERVP
ncbi:aldo/keto reductase [Flavobacteriaceae bacterium]|nr:aldo/keto reductase [Flavobacteriaceae bacterium]